MILKGFDLNQFESSWPNGWLALLLFLGTAVAAEPVKLDKYEVFRINSPQPIEPSGLTFKDQQLYTVCDDSNALFKLNLLDDQTAEAVVDQVLDVTQLSALNLDLEGVTVVDNEFFAISEVHHKLIRLQGQQLSWVPELQGVYAEAYAAGLFQVYNAGLEAVTYLGDNTFLLAAEREPRGLIEVTFDDDFKTIVKQSNQVFAESEHVLPGNRNPDLTGLYYHQGVIYALHRNAYLVHELVKDANGEYQEGRSWSYQHIVKHPDYAYQDMQFGHAEGLAVDDDYFYLVVDNNMNPSLKNPNDSRPILIQAKRK